MQKRIITYYHILNISPQTDDASVRNAYFKLAKKWHPDRHKNNKAYAERQFKLVHDAYMHLKTPPQRKAYDRKIVDIQKKRKNIVMNDNYKPLKRAKYKKNFIVNMAEVTKEIFWPLRSTKEMNNG